MKILLDEKKCSSLGMCEAVAPGYFEVGDDGALTVLDDSPGEHDRPLLLAAVASCPTGALALQE